MGVDSQIQLFAWVDVTYGVHPNLKATLTAACHLGKGWYISSPENIN